MCVTGALFNHFQRSPGSSRSDICKILCRPQWTWVRGGPQGMIELCPRLFPALSRICFVVPMVSIFSKVHLVHPEVSDLGTTLCWTCEASVVPKQIVVHCALWFRLHEVIITKTSQKQMQHVAKSGMCKCVFRWHEKHVLESVFGLGETHIRNKLAPRVGEVHVLF